MNPELKSRIDGLVQDNSVVLFMKGMRRMPQCGFSARVVQVLDQLVDEYETVNVLADGDIREGIKEYSNWPTIPQLYVNGKFVGGCDIVVSMFENGELHSVFGKEAPKVEPPKLTITPAAQEAFAAPLKEEGEGYFIRFSVDPTWRPTLDIDKPQSGDFEVDAGGIMVLVDRGSSARADGATIDFVPGPAGGFKIDNPNEPPRVRTISATELKSRMDAGEPFELFDVRTDQERAIAKIEGAKMLDQSAADYIEGLDREEATLVFHCKMGGRSMAAAQHFLQKGFKKVYNLQGGINAWSREVDDSVPLY